LFLFCLLVQAVAMLGSDGTQIMHHSTWHQSGSLASSDDCGTFTDKDILMMMFNALNGGNWTRNMNWNTPAALSLWFGVAIDPALPPAHTVISIDLSLNSLEGTLTNLSQIDLIQLCLHFHLKHTLFRHSSYLSGML
jgi:hypothetical protein